MVKQRKLKKIFNKKNLKKNWSMFTMFNTYFFKTLYGPGLALVFPPILLIIMGHILKLEYVFPGIIAFSSMIITVQTMPLGLMEMKNSTLFKYIGSSPVSSKSFIFIIIGYYVFINIIVVFLLIFTAMIAFHSQVFTGQKAGLFSGIVTTSGGFSFFCANILHTIIGLSIGIAISTFSKTPQQALTIGLLIVFPSMFLSGMVVTVDIIAQSKAMKIISYLTPFHYTTANIIVAATPSPQLGDFLNLLRYDENSKRSTGILASLFNVTNTGSGLKHGFDSNGSLWYRNVEVKNTGMLLALYDYCLKNNTLDTNFFNATTGIVRPDSKELFEIIFLKSRESVMVASDNDMFNIAHDFGVRRVPDIDSIRSLVKEWLNKTYRQTGSKNMGGVLSAISAGDYSWMDLFMKQSSVVYKIYDRSLNLFLPFALAIGLQFYAIKNFKWSQR